MPKSEFISILSYLCKKYPLWMNMKNQQGEIPMYLAIEKKDFDAFYCLCRYMTEMKINVKSYLKKQLFVEKMISFGSDLLQSPLKMKLILAGFDYAEIFRWTSGIKEFDSSNLSKDISLIKHISMIKGNNKVVEQVLFKQCGKMLFGKDNTKEEYNTEIYTIKHEEENKNLKTTVKKKEVEATKEIIKKTKITQLTIAENTSHENKNISIENTANSRRIQWIDIVYSSFIEGLSAADFVTDIIVLMQLFASGHLWWTTLMTLLLISPYLVSYSSLVTILKEKWNFERNCSCWNCIKSFGALCLLTPLALLCLVAVDITFMVYALVSTFWLFILFIYFSITTCCKNVHVVLDYDIRKKK
eukprot:45889_1